MRESGIKRARKYRRHRKSVTHMPQANALQISSRGIALTNSDLELVIGSTERRSDARAHMQVGPAQPMRCRFGAMQAELSAYL